MADIEETSTILVEVEVPSVEVTTVDSSGPQGEQGGNGWSPVLAVVADGDRRVYQVANWEGGEGTAPPVGQYIGATGFVSDIANAIDIRGKQGLQGIQGNPGADGAPGAVIIGEGAEILTGEGAPSDDIGAENQLYLDTLNGNLYKKENGTWGAPIANIRGPQGPQGERGIDGYQGNDGAQGLPGTAGWSPVLAVYNDGVRRVLRVTDWINGAGTKPATGGFVGSSGIVALPADAIDIRGPQGADGTNGLRGEKGDTGLQGNQGIQGPAGSNGWLPILAAAIDGERRVFQVVDWQGGTGTKPSTGGYLGAGGIVTDIAEATDVRGPQGVVGNDGAKGDKGDTGDDGATFDPAGEWSGATNYAAHSLVSENGSSYTNNAASLNQRPSTTPSVWTMVAGKGDQGTAGSNGSDGASGDSGWSPVFSIVNDGSRRVLRLSDWVGGEGTKPGGTGQYVGASGMTGTIADAIDIRGPQGVKGDQGIQGNPGPDPINAADITVNIFGKMNNNQKVLKQIVVRSFTLPSGLTHSNFVADVASSAAYTLTLYKNGASIGTLSWSAGGTVPAVTFASAVTFAEDDIFTITGQSVADATLADISLNFYGTR